MTLSVTCDYRNYTSLESFWDKVNKFLQTKHEPSPRSHIGLFYTRCWSSSSHIRLPVRPANLTRSPRSSCSGRRYRPSSRTPSERHPHICLTVTSVRSLPCNSDVGDPFDGCRAGSSFANDNWRSLVGFSRKVTKPSCPKSNKFCGRAMIKVYVLIDYIREYFQLSRRNSYRQASTRSPDLSLNVPSLSPAAKTATMGYRISR